MCIWFLKREEKAHGTEFLSHVVSEPNNPGLPIQEFSEITGHLSYTQGNWELLGTRRPLLDIWC